MRRFKFDEFVQRSNYPIRGDRAPVRLDCLCGTTSADEFGNRDLVPVPDCPWHGEGA